MVVCLKPPFSNQAMAVRQWWQALILQCVFLSAIFEWLQWCHDLENSPDITHTMIGQYALHYSEYINTQSLSLKKGLSFKLHISILFYLLLTSEAEKWKIFTDMLSRKFCGWKAFFFVWQNKNWLYMQNFVHNILQLNFSFNQCHKQEFSMVAHKGHLNIFHFHLIICDLTYSRSKLINSNTNLYLSI